MTYVNIGILVVIIFVCVYAIVNRICRCKEKSNENEMVTKLYQDMYEKWLKHSHPTDDIPNKFEK